MSWQLSVSELIPCSSQVTKSMTAHGNVQCVGIKVHRRLGGTWIIKEEHSSRISVVFLGGNS